MSKLPDANPTLTAYLVRARRQAERVANSSAFARSGTAVSAEGVVTVDGELDVTGDLNVSGNADITGPLAVHGTAAFDGASTIGGTLGVTGDATFSGDTSIGGNAAITGTLSLPAGIIDNAALASPVRPGRIYFTATHSLTASPQTVASAVFTVPAGFDTAIVSVSARAGGVNQNTTGGNDGYGGDYLGIDLHVGSVVGGGAGWVPGYSSQGECVALASDLLTGLTPGGTFTISVVASTQSTTWTTGVYVAVSGTALWFR